MDFLENAETIESTDATQVDVIDAASKTGNRPIEVRWSAMTHPGTFRANNEDRFLAMLVDQRGVRYLGKDGRANSQDADILFAIQELARMQGGQVAVADGKVKVALPLPIAGLVTDQPLPAAMKLIDALNAAAHSFGCDLEAPFMTLSFLALSPIPALKLTDQGLIDAVHLKRTSLFV